MHIFRFLLIGRSLEKPKRDFEQLRERNINTRKYFYPLTNEFGCYRGKFDVTKTPKALEISRQVLSLPMYADLEEETVQEICDTILS